MSDGPPTDLVPVKTEASKSPPSDAAVGKPPKDIIPVKKDAAPNVPGGVDSAAVKPPEQKGPLTGTQVLKDIPKFIGEDLKSGLHTESDALKRAGSSHGYGMLAGPEAALGAAEFAGAPITGTVRALAEPFKNVFPQDTTWGKMAYNAVYDAGVVFGPAAVNEMGAAIKTAAGPVRELMDNGVQLTLGQINGKFAKRFEEAAKSVPVLGSFIRGAEGRTMDSWNVVTINKIIQPFGKVEAKTAREAATKAEDIIDAKYDQVRASVPSLHKDADLDQDIIHLQNKIGELPQGLQDQFDNIVNNRLNNRFGIVGAMDGKAFKSADSELRHVAEGLRASQDAAQRELGMAVTDLRVSLRHALRRQYPNIADQLAEVDTAFGMLADVQRAGSASATSAGRFTPGQYLQSLRRSDRSARDKDFMKGLRPMQEWAEKSQEVIGSKMPDSGSAERLMFDIGGGSMIEGGSAYFDRPEVPIAIGAGSALYSAPGQAVTNAVAKASPDAAKAAGNVIRGAAAPGSAAEQLGLQ